MTQADPLRVQLDGATSDQPVDRDFCGGLALNDRCYVETVGRWTIAFANPWRPGDIKVTATTAAPSTRWLRADGHAVSRTAYPRLFAAIGTSFGTGDGSSTFNLPTVTIGGGVVAWVWGG